MKKINVFWFRRDLRLDDNCALFHALNSGLPVLPLFILDTNLTDELPADDPRISFILETLSAINQYLNKYGSSIYILKGEPLAAWNTLIESFDIDSVFINKDYEPYAIGRDCSVKTLLEDHGIRLLSFKDQVIFEESEITKSDGKPYTIFTPYSKKWRAELEKKLPFSDYNTRFENRLLQFTGEFPSPGISGFRISSTRVRPFDLSVIKEYHLYRDYPATGKTSYLGPHLRFGTISIRKLVDLARRENQVFLGELIWREFFMQILFRFPRVVTENFKSKFDNIQWRNDEKEFERWCQGETGYPMVDAGMRELNETGFMHNRVRMITAGFLCKHLLIDWRWGEAYFARKLLDFELSSNNGNWQWAAGTGCDAVPYFRVFNPDLQLRKFDPTCEYIRRWIPELDSGSYPVPMVDHNFARQRAITVYRAGMKL